MPDAIAPECKTISHNSDKFNMLYTAVIFLSLHWSLVAYVNATFLGQFISGSVLSILYVVSAILSILIFLSITKIIGKTGKHVLIISLAIIEMLALLGLGFLESLSIIIVLFVIHQTIVPLIFFNLDIYMEELIGKKESHTGSKRGLLLTIMSLCGAITALAAGYLIGVGEPHYVYVYNGAALLLLPFILIMVRKFGPEKKNQQSQISFSSHVLVRAWKEKDLRNVFGAHFLLQVFFTLTVIYIPLYLVTEIGMNWVQIGQVLFVGLMAYVIFEYPIGVIADKWFGEKEIMALGFLVIAVSTSWFIFIENPSVLPWMIVMFFTRLGASMVETTTESYFFKHMRDENVDVIGFFRATRPLSYIIGAAIGSLSLYLFEFEIIFLVFSLLMIPGFFFAMALHDTK